MYPWEHAAVAYLLYAGYARWHTGTAPDGWAVFVVLFASQLPDLIDKPLAWQFGLLPSGRSLAHSVFVDIPSSSQSSYLLNGTIGDHWESRSRLATSHI